MGKSGKSGERKRFFWQKKKLNVSQKEDLLDKTEQKNGHAPAQQDSGFTPPDGGWGWVVCLTSLWANGTVFGIINTFGIIYEKMLTHYSAGDKDVSLKTAFVGSTCTGVTFLMCTVSSILSDRVGIRPTAVVGSVLATAGLVASAFIQRIELLYLTFGVLLGVGSSMVYSPSLVILGHYFKKHMGLVNGIVAFGSSVFTIALTRILPVLLEKVDIKWCFIFLSGLHAMLIIFSLSWKPLFHHEDHLAHLTMSTESVYERCNDCCTWTRKFLNVKIWRNRAYVTWIVSLCVALFGYFVPFFHLPKHSSETFQADGSWLILCLSVTSGISRIVCGKVADLPWVNRIRMQQAAFVVLGISTLCIPFSKSFGGLIAISLVMGLCDGIFVCLLGPIAFDIVGPAEASQAIGFLLGIFSIPFTIGPPLAGWMYDTMGDYRVAFHVAGAPPILGAIIMFLIPKVQQNHVMPSLSFPAVTETMEFASISMMDVYNEVRVPQESRSKASINGTLSGPAAELQVITSRELLDMEEQQKKKMSRSPDNDTAEDVPMLQAECGLDTENEVEVGKEPKEAACAKDENGNPKEEIEGNSDHNKGAESQLESESIENGDNPTDKNENAFEEPTIEISINTPNLLNEVEKLLDATKVTLDSSEKTSV